ncbi:Aste57867_8994 [Aphanomyces stellatus]|uniref:Aste57867_8994 protein n=1 Tax=Aphanomyces stellatus TaxID=120398 RepID=A0A485KLT3_9STRA|nr:hypothetical protein As57867_008959 [Aphanomyces stellatus]VFT85878.1 Aste57867_8994 [Aphanomyces stellatus]
MYPDVRNHIAIFAMEAFLLACQTPAQVEEVLERSFVALQQRKNISSPCVDKAQEELDLLVAAALTPDESPQLSETLKDHIHNAQLSKLLLDLLHSDRRQLWRTVATRSSAFPSLPQLLDLNWRVNVQVASNAVHKSHDPSAFVDITTQEMPSNVHVFPALRHLVFQADRGTLDMVVDELHKIRNHIQLLQAGSSSPL